MNNPDIIHNILLNCLNAKTQANIRLTSRSTYDFRTMNLLRIISLKGLDFDLDDLIHFNVDPSQSIASRTAKNINSICIEYPENPSKLYDFEAGSSSFLCSNNEKRQTLIIFKNYEEMINILETDFNVSSLINPHLLRILSEYIKWEISYPIPHKFGYNYDCLLFRYRAKGLIKFVVKNTKNLISPCEWAFEVNIENFDQRQKEKERKLETEQNIQHINISHTYFLYTYLILSGIFISEFIYNRFFS